VLPLRRPAGASGAPRHRALGALAGGMAADRVAGGREAEPSKYWLSNLPPGTALRDLVHTAKARWVIERDYQELKQEIGLGHYEGRGWRGFHHHASLCIAAYGFLVAERCLFPPRRRFTRQRKAPALPRGFRPRGAPDPA
jgi:SRSO17 transposase